MSGRKRKQRKLPPVVWGYENGQQIVTRAVGRHATEMPAVRIHGLRETIREMGGIVDAFAIAADLPDDRSQKIMMRVTAKVAIDLMQDAADDMRAILALSPMLREIVARVDAGRKQTPRHLRGTA